ncbi:MAG: ribosome biogenesis GTP-binding protein YihA/YsxC [Phycisphaerales bacterium]|nr:ribosome biogenesis GTP-binding protein YihA/YsxC [Phycisphaerales bacterium]
MSSSYIISAEYITSSPSIELCPPPNKPEFVFLGRSNVGKSSLINLLSNKKKLAYTSGTPGKTRLINHYLINGNFYWVDLPGYGYAQVSIKERDAWQEMIKTYLTQRTSFAHAFVLIDSRLPPQPIDINFINSLASLKISCSLIFTKIDKVKPNLLDKQIDAFKQQLQLSWSVLPKDYRTSATKRTGHLEILNDVATINQELTHLVKKK